MSRRLLCLYLPDISSEVKARLLAWSNRYSPLAAEDGFGGIVLDITGCAHLFGGEEAMLNDVQLRIRRAGHRVRGAIADTLGAAWALARYSKQVIVTGSELPQALNPLPVEALRLPEEITRALRRVGLSTIAAFQKVGRQALVTRFGSSILLRLDQAFGKVEETITPYRRRAPYSVRRTLAEPIATTSAVEYVLLELLQEICARLEKEHMGARCLNLDCYRVDGTVVPCVISTSKPVRSVKHLIRLFSEKLSSIDAGFGIETLILSVPNVDRFDPAQLTLPQFDPNGVQDTAMLDELIDRVGARLGFQHVSKMRICESLLPEYAMEFRSVTADEIPSALWPEYRIRPVYWVDPPMHIEVATIHPGGAPVRFRRGRDMYRILKSEGPERLTPEWWRLRRPGSARGAWIQSGIRQASARALPGPEYESCVWESRDYYRIEDDRGSRFWIYQEFYLPPSLTTRWFLRGHLP